ncbi:hemolysin D [Dulcicalothrix desertica PCC 7102]|uniref:Hemolysin D n=1 Tax=Dulcicalothrix desertica PCC 7102 TaxID=232991 RepID=A0A3S1CF82_9CYAN|nr:efflux RND transporter periplasmic adaptor subunit [Dulcicalothrix desertica]RUT01562.1 hemolysin D [Dulcicalothrix desertica PCC 7102]
MESFESQHSNNDRSLTPKLKPGFWAMLALVLLGGGVGFWWFMAPGKESPPTVAGQHPATKVQVTTLQSSTIEESAEFVANLESRRSVTLRPRIQGQVSQIFVRAGERVKRDTPILKVDAKQQQASVDSRIAAYQSSQADLETAQAELKSAQADAKNATAALRALKARRASEQSDLRLNQSEYERFNQLYKEGASSLQILEQRRNSLETAKAKLAQTDADIAAQEAMITRAQAVVSRAKATIVKNQRLVNQARANIKEQAAELQFYTITAPFAGIVGDIPVKVGDFVDTSTQLISVSENGLLEVNISVPVEQVAQLRLGSDIELVDGQGRNIGTSRIFFIAPNTANQTQSVLVKALLDNSQLKLRTDQFVRARVVLARRPGVLIPTSAITRLAKEAFVFVVEERSSQSAQPQFIARQKPVELGGIENNQYQVIKGLRPGERIITSGLLGLRDGAPIIPEPEKSN